MSYTKGPWRVDKAGWRIVSDGKTIAIIIGDSSFDYEEWKGNAHLLASAPELLEACKLAISHLTISCGLKNWEGLETLKNVIARAEGK